MSSFILAPLSRFVLPAVPLILLGIAGSPCIDAQEVADSRIQVEVLPGTQPLLWQGDIASRLVDSASAFLLDEIAAAREQRGTFWQRDTSSPEAYVRSVAPNRERLANIAGVRDARIAGPLERLGEVADADRFTVTAVRWPVFTQVHGEGLLLEPKGETLADAVVIPDAGETPEQDCGLAEGLPPQCHWARHLAASGVRVLVPVVINREVTHRQLRNREFLYRSAFELGRHLIGHEVQKVLAGIDWLEASRPEGSDRLVGVSGYGEGGLLALYAGALDQRIDVTAVSGYFGPREGVWQELADRNVFGLLEQFGDAEIASLIAPRALVVEAVPGKEVTVPPGTGGKPGTLSGPAPEATLAELARARTLVTGLERAEMIAGGLPDFAQRLGTPVRGKADAAVPAFAMRTAVDAGARHARQMEELDRHNQWLLRESAYVRQQTFWSKLDTSSVEAYERSTAPLREHFATEVIGRFDLPLADDPAPRTRKLMETEKVTYYETVLDVFEDSGFFAYGILLVPKGIPEGKELPCVVCQHGLEGRPQDVIGEPGFGYYQAFATSLAEQGFVTFAPQHLYIFEDRFRELQFKANAIGKTLFSLMVPQHQQLVRWLGSQTFIDADRIGFYGLSYGGKSAMRIPPLVPEYKLSICSADFNEWVWKNASTRSPYSYVWTGEYEIFEFDLGSMFNYAEMAALIAPRPFMVERGHFDGVAPDETVAYEFAKVRFLYNARLKLPGRAEIEWFDGPHRINGKGTFAFLREHL